MDKSAYIHGLLSVMVGLGLSSMLQSFHRLLRLGKRVRWHWIPVSWAVLALLMVVQSWWAYFSIVTDPVWTNLFAFLLPLLVFIVLFMISASVLPDAKSLPETGPVDLAAMHFTQRRYFFTLWATLMVLAVLVTWIVDARVTLGIENAFRLGALAAAVTLVVTGNRTVHGVITALSLIVLISYIALYSLRLS